MSILFVNEVNLQQATVENQLLVVYTLTLKAFYLTTTKLVWFTYISKWIFSDIL